MQFELKMEEKKRSVPSNDGNFLAAFLLYGSESNAGAHFFLFNEF
jgi:hypothetical protein